MGDSWVVSIPDDGDDCDYSASPGSFAVRGMFEKLPKTSGWSFPRSAEIQAPLDPEALVVLNHAVFTGLFFPISVWL